MNCLFPYFGNVIIPSDELIFFRGVETTNQILWCYGQDDDFYHGFPDGFPKKIRQLSDQLTGNKPDDRRVYHV